MNRRRLICGCAAGLAAALTPWRAEAQPRTHRGRTCALRSLSADDAALLALPRMDLGRVVAGLGPVVTQFSTLYGAKADIFVIAGAGAPDNAFAMPAEGADPERMVIGKPLLDRYGATAGDWWRLIVAGVIAHEFGHFWQMQNMPYILDASEPPKLAELQADFMAGYALSFHKRSENILIDAFAREMFSLGDTEFTSPYHHGTPQERQAAMIEGFRQGIQPATPPTIDVIARNGAAFARASKG